MSFENPSTVFQQIRGAGRSHSPGFRSGVDLIGGRYGRKNPMQWP